MSEKFSLTEHIGGGMPARFYINGKRVPRSKYESIRDQGHSFGRVECFHTKAREIAGGKTRRTNYSLVTL